VVALTALAMNGDREAVLATGFDGYISKPIKVRAFIAQVGEPLPSTSALNTQV
jgi:CheY-like chemotaxis protein